VQNVDVRDRVKRRTEARVGTLRRRTVLASALSFAAFFGLAAQHAVGASKRHATAPSGSGAVAATAPTTFFDQRGDGYAFDDGTVAAGSSGADSSAAPPAPSEQPAPVAQSSVS
jgi:hypothetical protein